VTTKDDFPRFRRLKSLQALPADFFACFIILYCLNGGRLPWKYLGREISLSVTARLALARAAHRCRRKLMH